MNTAIDFSKTRMLFFVVSLILIVGGIAGTIIQGGFNLGIDFQAGLSMRVQIDSNAQNLEIGQVRQALTSLDGSEVQSIGPDGAGQFTVRVRDDGSVPGFEDVVSSQVLEALGQAFGSVEVLEQSYVGPRFSEDLTSQAIWLVTLAVGLILVYLWFRFRIAYAVSSVIALVHDVIIMIGFFGTFQVELTSATIAAILTIVGYSLNDTIVIFDRIRENEKLLSGQKIGVITNASINQSLSRTVITSLTTLVAVVAIFIFTTGQIKDFALALMVGILVGTYSSIYIASPFFEMFHKTQVKRGTAPAVPAKTN
ncbi:protein translocase subunit SecF [Spirochaeta lutea]|uniref:protein translocase subunit SecF n=1 Tax=Spirochaeta lutea TaxID=1480694 RepID=UPI00068F1582|nr:protein translocase subunit SecF [Spirochaeta lutea]